MTGTERPAAATVVDVPTAAAMLGIGRTLAYHLVRTGQWPTPLIRVGRLIKVPTKPLLEYVNGGARDGAQTVRPRRSNADLAVQRRSRNRRPPEGDRVEPMTPR